jgi:hypothetical protein
MDMDPRHIYLLFIGMVLSGMVNDEAVSVIELRGH